MLEQLRHSQYFMVNDYLIDIFKSKICYHCGLEALTTLAESERCAVEAPSLETFAVIAIRTLPCVTLKDVLDALPDRTLVFALNRVSRISFTMPCVTHTRMTTNMQHWSR